MVVVAFVNMAAEVVETVMVGTVETGAMATLTWPVAPDCAVAVIVTVPELMPVRVVVAMPLELVTAEVSESEPSVVLFRLKVTVVFGTKAPPLSLTVAVTVDVPPDMIAVGAAIRETVPPPAPPPMLIDAEFEMLPIAPVTTTVVVMVPAVNVTDAIPDVFVVA